jgi:hypothetical protein
MSIFSIIRETVCKVGIFFAVIFLAVGVFIAIQPIASNSAKTVITIALLLAVVVFIRKPISYGWLRHRAFYLGILLALPVLWAEPENSIQPPPKKDATIVQKQAKPNNKMSTDSQKEVVQAKEENSPEKMPEGSEFLYNERDLKKVTWILKGKETISSLLKDSDSAKFRHLFFSGKVVPIVCGEVNSKNSFGGYVGYQKFVTANQADLTVLETEMKPGEFGKVWNKFCAN